MAEYGHGKPVIAILGEYDALPGLSQEADCPVKKPVEGKPTGHGCGHNLLGTGSVEAVCAVQDAMDHHGIKGTIRYYGCPAEEGGNGKIFIVRSGAFEDVDIAMSWHPSMLTGLMAKTLCCTSTKFAFKGISAHAGVRPEAGRSALDAAELMNIGTQFLREHIPAHSKVQYAFVNAGTPQSNIVPDYAELTYTVRDTTAESAKDVQRRLCKIAEGAALMTETELMPPVVDLAYTSTVPNHTLFQLVLKTMGEHYPLSFTDEEVAYARTFAPQNPRPAYNAGYNPSEEGALVLTTDFADVSWVVPSVEFLATCFATGGMAHHWSWTAQGKSSAAHKGMHTAAKVLASCAVDLYENPELVQQAKADFEAALSGASYESMLPQDAKPPVEQ